MPFAGIDIGSTMTKVVIVDDQGRSMASVIGPTGAKHRHLALTVTDEAVKKCGLSFSQLDFIVATGYGRINVPFADKQMTEITCHARGIWSIFPSTHAIIDIGGQDSKGIKLDAEGKVANFVMNDKCAAGTGRGMEVFAELLSVPIEDMGRLSFEVEAEPAPVSSTCVVFAKSEAVGLLRKGWSKEMVLAAYSSAMAHRVVELLERIQVEQDFAITGGIAKNEGVVRRIEAELKIKALEPKYDTQIAGALGAALFAKALVEKERGLR
jgi:bzd-type benzoyl-CoA reductase Q subunit